MTGATFADAEVFDWSAPSGSHTFSLFSTPHLMVDSSENSSTTYFQPSAALDHNNDTAWETNGLYGNPTSLTLRQSDFAPIQVVSYTLVQRNGWAGRAPRDWTLYGSNDTQSWTSVDDRSGYYSWSSPGNVKTFVLSTPATFVYWKLVVTQTANGDILNLGEIYFNDIENTAQAAAAYYVRMTGIPRGRIVTVSFAGDILKKDWEYQWQAFVTEYPESSNEYTGRQYWYPYASPPAPRGNPYFYGTGKDMVLRVALASYSDFTVTWTSTESPTPLQPNTWYDRQVLNPAGGTITYNGVEYAPGSGADRYYSLTPTTSDPLTISTNEPNCYYEIYAQDGIYSFDGWVEDGFNDAAGIPKPGDGVLQISPIVGQEYVIAVYPNSLPAPETEYVLTWGQESFVPPYVVSNDMFVNALNLGLATDGMTHGYDNTGATTDPELSWAKRSIWYRFHVDTPQALKLTLTPSDATPTRDPSMRILYSDLSYVGGGGPGPGQAATAFLKPGLEYYLVIWFDSATPTSDWEQHGAMAFELVPVPASMTDPTTAPPVILQPGSVEPGGGQNYHVGPIFPGFALGASATVQIVAPHDGGLSFIVEAGSEGGTMYQPGVEAFLPYDVEGYNYQNGQYTYKSTPLSLNTNDYSYPWNGYKSFRWLPWRAVGATTPDPITIRVKAGDAIRFSVYAPSGAYIRWGMATKGATSDWFSARYGDVITVDGTYIPDPGWMPPEFWPNVRANASAWPSGIPLGAAPGDTRAPVVDYNSNYVGSNGRNADDGGIVTNLIKAQFLADISGDNGARSVEDQYTDIARNDINFSAMHDPGQNATRQEIDTALRIVRQQAYVQRNPVTTYDFNGTQGQRSPADLHMQTFQDANMPVLSRAQNHLLNAYRPIDPASPYAQYFDGSYEMLMWSIEWEGVAGDEPPPVWNLYRWVDNIGLFRGVRAPYDPLDSYVGTPVTIPDPLNIRLYSIPVELTDQPWILPSQIEDAGQIVHEVDVAAEVLTGFVNKATVQPNLGTGISDSHDDYFTGPIPFDRDLVQTDVFSGAPKTGDRGFDITYAMLIEPYRLGSMDFDGILQVAWNDHGMEPPHYFTHSMGGGIQAEMHVRTRLSRLYPPRFRVAKWVPSLDAIAVSTPTDPNAPSAPGAGFYIVPHPNLDGEAKGVDVHFASAT